MIWGPVRSTERAGPFHRSNSLNERHSKQMGTIKCGMCNGSGTVGAGRDKQNCPNCGGSGEME